MTTRRNLLKLFRRHADLLVTCPECLLLPPMSLSDFMDTHVFEAHQLNRHACAFCLGHFVWRPGHLTDSSTVEHQRTCFQTFRNLNTHVSHHEPMETEPPDPDAFAMVCQICMYFDPAPLTLFMAGRAIVPSWQEMGYYDPLFRKPEWWEDSSGIPFDPNSGIGQDTSTMLNRFDEFKWYHVSVKPFAFLYFKREMICIQEHFAVLPYGCLCDGLITKKAKDQKSHRHMIIAVKNASEKKFKSIWEKKVLNPDYTGLLGKVLKSIRNQHHLVCCIQYLSQEKSKCDGKHLQEDCVGPLSHHRIDRPVHPHGEVSMCMLYSGGLQEYIAARNKPKLVLRWLQVVQHDADKKFVVPLSFLELNIENCVIPVRRDLRPYAILKEDHDQYPFKLWLHERNECLVFKEDPEWAQLSKEEWYLAQKREGNYFFGSLFQSLYTLTPGQQKTMRQLKTLDKTRETELQEKLRIAAHERKRLQQENHQLQRENDYLQQQNHQLQQENEQLKQ